MMKPLRSLSIFLLILALLAGGYFYIRKTDAAAEANAGLPNRNVYKSETLLYDQTWAYLLPYCKTYVNADFIQKLHNESVPMKLRFDKAFDSTEIVLFSLFQGGARRVYFSKGQQWSSDVEPVTYKVIPEFFTHSISGHSNELIYKSPSIPMAVGYYHLQGNLLSLVSGNGAYTTKTDIIDLGEKKAQIKLNFGSDSVAFTGIDISNKMNGIHTRIEEIDHGFFVHLLDIIAREELGVQDSSPVQQYIDNFLQQ